MANPRVHEIASAHAVEPRVVLQMLKAMGEFVKGPSSSIPPPVARRVAAHLEVEGYPLQLRLGAKFRAAAPALMARLPMSIPALVDLIASENERRTGEWHRRLDRCLKARQFYWAPSRSVAQARSANVTQLVAAELPSPTGVALLRTAEADVALVGWEDLGERLQLNATTLRQRPTKVPTVAAIGADLYVASLTGDAFLVPEGSARHPLALLAGLVSVIPIRSRRQEAEGVEETEGVRMPGPKLVREAGGVRLVDLVRRVAEPRASAPATKRQSRWEVRGHWRNQWHPSIGEHRRVWIAEHFAGPADGTPIKHDTVRVVRA